MPGAWKQITIPQVTTNYLRSVREPEPDEDSTLPIILRSTSNTGTGLRFEYNDDNARDARDHIDLLWTATKTRGTGQDEPNGYVIDRSPDDGATWEALRRADTPNDLGTADTFTDNQDVTPGHKYTYRVFPVFIESGPDAYGIPALIEANSRGADLPGAARSVRAVGDGQNACLVTWRAPSDDGGHPVRGYLIQMAPDEDGSPGTFVTIDVVDGTPPFTVMGEDATEFKYTGATTQVATEDLLSAGSVRWFRVIPVTDENDGVRLPAALSWTRPVQRICRGTVAQRTSSDLPLMEDDADGLIRTNARRTAWAMLRTTRSCGAPDARGPDRRGGVRHQLAG